MFPRRALPVFAPGHPAEWYQRRWPGMFPSLRVPSSAVGDPSAVGGHTGKTAWEPGRLSKPLRGAAAGPPFVSCCCRDSPSWSGAVAGSGTRRGGGRTALTLITLPVGWHGSPGRRGQGILALYSLPLFFPPRFPFIHKPGGYIRSLNIDVSSPNCSSVNPITEFIKNCVELSLSIQYQH